LKICREIPAFASLSDADWKGQDFNRSVDHQHLLAIINSDVSLSCLPFINKGKHSLAFPVSFILGMWVSDRSAIRLYIKNTYPAAL
jgi:hypothetical protein